MTGPIPITRRALAYACFAIATCVPCAAWSQAPGSQPATAAATPETVVFANVELDQMLAPIALYPDALLAQILMASTYPGNVADAAKWSKAHPDAKGDDAVRQVADQPWDPSVQALVAFPPVLASLAQDSAWVQRMGDAFLAQPDGVMDSVQRLRAAADKAGNLQSNEYQKISKENSSDPGAQTIVIDSAEPEVVYVPNYDPNTIYGSWGWSGYPPYYYPPPAYYYPGGVFVRGVMWGVALSAGNALWGNMTWGGGSVDINVNRYNNINSNRQINRDQGRWQHDSAHRDGTPYRDQRSRDTYGKQLDGARDRSGFRGDDAQRVQARNGAAQSMDRRGMDSPARSNVDAQDRARQNSAFSGSRDPGATRQASQRGNQSMSRSGASRGASRPMSRPPMRGGGGGRRR
jgi:hypothetical protein